MAALQGIEDLMIARYTRRLAFSTAAAPHG